MIKQADICVLVNGYPYGNSNACIFVKNLVEQWVRMGYKCIVIAPQSISRIIVRGETRKPYKMEIDCDGKKYDVFSPKVLSFAGKESFLGINLHELSRKMFYNAIFNTCEREKIYAEKYYGHFLWNQGIIAAYLKEKRGGKAFCALGEGTDTIENGFTRCANKSIIKKIDGFISVNSKNKRYITKEPFNISEEKVLVAINATDINVFNKKNKDAIRDKLSIDKNHFIVCFCGSFEDRKGSMRLSNAIDELDDVHSFFIGEGKEEPNCKNILFKGKLKQEEVVDYLNASDVFVLPTINEGCCNAIVEAITCGVPVISANLEFNNDLMISEGTIGIDPMSEEEIRNAILFLKNNPEKRLDMSKACINYLGNYSLKQRASIIMDFMNRN